MTGFICFMLAAVFSWTTMSTVAGNSTLPLTWSPCVWVLMIRTTGFVLSSLILSRIGVPQPGFFVSTTVMPSAMTNTAVFPPPPLRRKKLSLSFSTSTTLGAGGCWYAFTAIDNVAIATSVESTMARLMRAS